MSNEAVNNIHQAVAVLEGIAAIAGVVNQRSGDLPANDAHTLHMLALTALDLLHKPATE